MPVSAGIEKYEVPNGEVIELLHLFCDICEEEIFADEQLEVIDGTARIRQMCGDS